MDSDGLPIVGAGVDYTKVGPIHQKRTLTFLNHFLIRTTSFLNHFATICDEKLENLLIRIQKLEASMCILEAKLASIPGLEDVALSNQSSPSHETGVSQAASSAPETPAAQPSQDAPQAPEAAATAPPPPKPAEEEKPVLKVSQDPRYAKYFKMVNMGVPALAVKQKMTNEGVDADLLDDPDAEAPPGAPADVASEDAGQTSSSELSD